MSKKKSKLNRKKASAHRLYKSWKSVDCPALKAKVHFTNLGWDHLSKTKWRTGIEKIERFELLPLARKLLSKTTTVQDERYQDGNDHVEFTAIMGGIKVKVIVKKVSRKYYFYSVFKV